MSSRRILTSTRLERKKRKEENETKEQQKTAKKNRERPNRRKASELPVGRAVRDFADYQCVICARKFRDDANKID